MDEQTDLSLAVATEEETASESSFSADSWLSLSDFSGPSATTVTVIDNPGDLSALIERFAGRSLGWAAY